MKKYLAALALVGILAACGGGSDVKKGGDSSADLSSNPDYVKGLDLIGKNDCLTCHNITGPKIGPAYDSVANMYANMDTAVEHLAKKIIAGGSGVWGSTPMTPHATLALDSAKQIVKYILLLKTK